MKIRAKLLAGFLTIALLCGLVGLLGVLQLSRLEKSIAFVPEVTLPTITNLDDIAYNLAQLKATMRTISNPMGVDDEVYYKRQIDNIAKFRDAYNKAMSDFEGTPMTAEESRLWADFKAYISTAKDYNDSIVGLVEQARALKPQAGLQAPLALAPTRAGAPAQAAVQAGTGAAAAREAIFAQAYTLIAGDKRLVYDTMLVALDKLRAYAEKFYGTDVTSRDIKSARSSIVIMLIITLAVFLVSTLVGLFLGNSIARSLRKTVGKVDQIARGDLSQKMEISTKDEFGDLGKAMNISIDSISALVADAAMLAKAAVEGRLATRADATRHQGDYRKIVEGVNQTLDAVIGPLNVAASYVDQISKGAIPAKITDSYNGDFNVIKNNLNLCIDAVNNLVADAGVLSKAAVEGRLATRADASKHQGDYRRIVDGVNQTLDAVIGPLNVAASYVDQISKGAIPAKITDSYNGDFNVIKNNLNVCIEAVNSLVADALMLSKAAEEGKLQTRADANKHQGDYRKIVEGVNQTLDLVISPINETTEIMKHLAEGDLTTTMTGSYKGDFDVLKSALNASLESINDILSQVSTAVDQVTAGSQQVSQASQSLSQGATEQASSLEEITSSITEISSQTKLNTENAVQVNGLAKTARDDAEKGNVQMKDLVAAMTDINSSAEEIRKIVKAIDDISFQINLLALNANVEAARAGKYGKGFAVVAEEVRNLAVRSANSVKDTTRMVDEAISNIARGNGLVDVTAKQLTSIVGGAAQVAGLAEQVAVAGKEQALGLEQVTTGLNQIDQVTQANTASAEESASAAEELSSQSQQLKAMLARFKLKSVESKVSNSEVLAMLRNEMARQAGSKAPAQVHGLPAKAGKKGGPGANPADLISLDDGDFGKF